MAFALPWPAWACNVPVFRYALERWPADTYRLNVYFWHELDPAIEKKLDGLAERPSNVAVSFVDLEKANPEDTEYADVKIERKDLPWLVLRYPDRDGPSPVAWSGRLEADTLDRLIDSPLRHEVVRRIASGESAVWVFLESGDAEKDRNARQVIERQVTAAEKELQIPKPDQLDYSVADLAPAGDDNNSPDGSPVKIPLKVDFSVLTLSRSNPAEALFVAMLLESEPDLREYSGEPMAFPIFGQGRVLWALVGKGINAENVAEACEFLVKGCSCQVKSMNPGVDLLTSADWTGLLEGSISVETIGPTDLTIVAPRLGAGEEPVERPQAGELSADKRIAATAPVASESSSSAGSRSYGVLVGAGVVLGLMLAVAAIATVVLTVRKSQ